MTKLRVHAFTISLDGYGAGVLQSLDNPLGVGGMALHPWMIGTRTFQNMIGNEGGATGVDDDFAARGLANVGAWILGRNMFGPIRGAWPDETWKGWWGANPPYHTSVFVLTHYGRPSIAMEGGTTFHFVTGGILEALKRATDAAGGQDVRLGGEVGRPRETAARPGTSVFIPTIRWQAGTARPGGKHAPQQCGAGQSTRRPGVLRASRQGFVLCGIER